MKRILNEVLVYSLLLCVLFSCATANKNSKKTDLVSPPSSAEIAFQKAVNSGSIDELIRCAIDYPEVNEDVYDYLIWDIDINSLPYNDINRYVEQAKEDTLLQYGFQNQKELLEEMMLDELSDLDIDGVRDYYYSHLDASDFVGSVITDAIEGVVQDNDYFSIKAIYKAFQGTEFSGQINEPYLHLRDSLMTEINLSLDEYESSLVEIIQSVKSQVTYELDTLVINSIARVSKNCMDKKLPRRDQKAEERIESMYSDFVNHNGARAILRKNIDDLSASVDESFSTLFDSFFPDIDSLFTPGTESVKLSYPKYVVLKDEFLDFSDIQRDINWVAVGLTAASVATGIATGGATTVITVVIDGADLVYGIVGDSKKTKKVKAALESLQEDMYRQMNTTNRSAISSTFARVDEYVASNFAKLRDTLYEEF